MSKPDTKLNKQQNQNQSNNIHKVQGSSKVTIPDTETKALSHSKRMKISVPKKETNNTESK